MREIRHHTDETPTTIEVEGHVFALHNDGAVHELLIEMGKEARDERLMQRAVSKFITFGTSEVLTDAECFAVASLLLSRIAP